MCNTHPARSQAFAPLRPVSLFNCAGLEHAKRLFVISRAALANFGPFVPRVRACFSHMARFGGTCCSDHHVWMDPCRFFAGLRPPVEISQCDVDDSVAFTFPIVLEGTFPAPVLHGDCPTCACRCRSRCARYNQPGTHVERLELQRCCRLREQR